MITIDKILFVIFLILAIFIISQISFASSPLEDYTTEINKLHFGDSLRATQLETERVYTRAHAIACQEGFYKQGSIAQRNNNPGNLRKSGYPRKNGHSYFESDLQGWMELYKLLYKNNHLSLEAIGKFYAEDPNWARGVRRCHD
jgi:hypothetical protein